MLRAWSARSPGRAGRRTRRTWGDGARSSHPRPEPGSPSATLGASRSATGRSEGSRAPVATWPIDIPTRFRDFDDYRLPFLGGTGPASGFVVGLDEERREALRERLRATLPIAADGSIDLIARAWAVRAERP